MYILFDILKGNLNIIHGQNMVLYIEKYKVFE